MILPHHNRWPVLHETAFVAPSADVIGEVSIGAHSSVWFQCVVRGDVAPIRIGARTNVQDHCMLHVTRARGEAEGKEGGDGQCPLQIGDEVTIGHRAVLHGCRIGNRVLIGMGAIVLDNAEIGDECIVGAGTLVTKGTRVPPRSLVLGAPARVARALSEEELAYLAKSAENYVNDAAEYRGYVQGPARLGESKADLEDFREYGEFEGPDELNGDFSEGE